MRDSGRFRAVYFLKWRAVKWCWATPVQIWLCTMWKSSQSFSVLVSCKDIRTCNHHDVDNHCDESMQVSFQFGVSCLSVGSVVGSSFCRWIGMGLSILSCVQFKRGFCCMGFPIALFLHRISYWCDFRLLKCHTTWWKACQKLLNCLLQIATVKLCKYSCFFMKFRTFYSKWWT